MSKKLVLLLLTLFCPYLVGYCFGFETRGQDCSKCHTLSKEEASDLLKGIFPG